MLDDLRNSATIQEEPPAEKPRRDRESGEFLGMTSAQRFIIVLLLFLMVCVLGTFCLVVTGRVWLPI